MKNVNASLLLALVICAAACGSSALVPATISSSDMCNYCRMAISEKRYAAEFFDNEGEVYKFDEIGCMRNFVAKQNLKPKVVFVKDFDSKQWLNGANALYVRSSNFHTPMNGQIAAFKDKQAADRAAKLYNGTILSLW